MLRLLTYSTKTRKLWTIIYKYDIVNIIWYVKYVLTRSWRYNHNLQFDKIEKLLYQDVNY